MGLLLSILFSYVGAVEFMFIVRDVVHQVGLHHNQMKIKRSSTSNGLISTAIVSSSSLLDLQQNLRKSIKSAQERLNESDTVQSMEDGVRYEHGYRILSDDEENISKRWLEARASVTIEPEQLQQHSNAKILENNFVTSKSDDFRSENDSLHSSSLSVDTVVERNIFKSSNNDDVVLANSDEQHQTHLINSSQSNRNNCVDNNNDDEVPDIHFDEYSEAYLHALDGVTTKSIRKNDDNINKRRKGFRNHSSANEMLQRRRSEDVDGETDNPWGELKPESFHDDDLWKRERAMSIAENDEIQAIVNEKSYQNRFSKAIADTRHNPSIESEDEHEYDENKNVSSKIVLIEINVN